MLCKAEKRKRKMKQCRRSAVFRRYLSALLAAAAALALPGGCGPARSEGPLSYEEAEAEAAAMVKKIEVSQVESPVRGTYPDELSETEVLEDIGIFPVVTSGDGEINIEIAATEELCSEAPGDWISTAAQNFNEAGITVGGKRAAVSVRRIPSGEAVTYIQADVYHPQMFIPSSDAWGKMLEISIPRMEKITDRLAGNTAGILIRDDVYEGFIKKYKEPTVAHVLEAAMAGDLQFAYADPYTSGAGLNILTAMLKTFDGTNPLSGKAQDKLLDYQRSAPPVSGTMAELADRASRGVINAMAMDEQTYINTPELADYVYTPVGIRQDHPAYIFDYCTMEEREAALLFVKYCQNEESQSLAAERGYNRHDEYVSQDPGMDGLEYITAQKIWRKNKNGGQPVIAVFVADFSASVNGEALHALTSSLAVTASRISSECYVGLVSCSDDVTVHLPVRKFDERQRKLFSGEVKNMSGGGGSAACDALPVALHMLAERAETLPDARLKIFLLSDRVPGGNGSLQQVMPVIEGMQVPVYTVSYEYDDGDGSLHTLSAVNGAVSLQATGEDIANRLRDLFNLTV